jgi:hypothetical protein
VISIFRFLKISFAFFGFFFSNSAKRSFFNIKMSSVCIYINSKSLWLMRLLELWLMKLFDDSFWLMKSKQRSYVDFVILRSCLWWSWYILNQCAFASETS